jgi:hypothetical protein
VDAVQVIQQAAKAGDWRAALTVLERRFPAERGRRSAHEVSGPGGEPLLGGDKLSDADLELLRELYRRAR